MRRLPVALGAVLLLGGSVWAGDAIYYRRNADGTLVITNVPDRRDLRVLRPETRRVHPGVGALYRDLIHQAAREHGLHPELVYAVVAVESSFDRHARSVKGAQGLMQLMPETAERFGVVDPYDPADNLRGGTRYLRYLLDLFRGDVRLALASYNAGENIVQSLGRIPPYPETRNYVARIMKRFGPGREPYLAAPDVAVAPAAAAAPADDLAAAPTPR